MKVRTQIDMKCVVEYEFFLSQFLLDFDVIFSAMNIESNFTYTSFNMIYLQSCIFTLIQVYIEKLYCK